MKAAISILLLGLIFGSFSNNHSLYGGNEIEWNGGRYELAHENIETQKEIDDDAEMERVEEFIYEGAHEILYEYQEENYEETTEVIFEWGNEFTVK